jgi:hypothetical protein
MSPNPGRLEGFTSLFLSLAAAIQARCTGCAGELPALRKIFQKRKLKLEQFTQAADFIQAGLKNAPAWSIPKLTPRTRMPRSYARGNHATHRL